MSEAAPARGPTSLDVRLVQDGPIPLDVTLRCRPGELLALTGPSGSGKTSVLRAIAGLLRPKQGRITCGGEVWLDAGAGIWVRPQARRVGLVFQDYAVFGRLTVLDNLSFGLEAQNVPRTERKRRIEENRDPGDGRDGEADAGEGRAEREVEARLQAVGSGRAHRGDALREEDDRGDDDADHGLGRAGPGDELIDGRGQQFREPDHGDQAKGEERGAGRGQQPRGRGRCPLRFGRRREKIVAMAHGLHKDERAIEK